MKKNYLFLLLLGFFAKGQITYEAKDFAKIGTEHKTITTVDKFPEYDFTKTGENYDWNFADLIPENINEIEDKFSDPNDSGYKTSWCLINMQISCNSAFNNKFNLAQKLVDNFAYMGYDLKNGYSFFNKSNSGLELRMLGGRVNFNGNEIPATIEYKDSDVVYKFPMKYNDAYTDKNLIDTNFKSLGVDAAIKSEGTRESIVDGWGKLAIPNLELENVLRLKSTLKQSAKASFDGKDYNYAIDLITYQWFAKEFPIPVLTITGTMVEDTFVTQSITFINNGGALATTESALDEKLVILENPVQNEIKTNLKSINQIQIYNTNGQLVGQSLQVGHLQSGIYFIKVVADNKVYQTKFIKK